MPRTVMFHLPDPLARMFRRREPEAPAPVTVSDRDGLEFLDQSDVERCCTLIRAVLEDPARPDLNTTLAANVRTIAGGDGRWRALGFIASQMGDAAFAQVVKSGVRPQALIKAFLEAPHLRPLLAEVNALFPRDQQGKVLDGLLRVPDIQSYVACIEHGDPHAPVRETGLRKLLRDRRSRMPVRRRPTPCFAYQREGEPSCSACSRPRRTRQWRAVALRRLTSPISPSS